MTDRELLEAAAKAAGYGAVWYLGDGGTPYVGTPYKQGGPVDYRTFSPLTDDGDALRLAVKLRVQIAPTCWECCVYAPDGARIMGRCSYGEIKDLAAATRRAIVRAAAAMSTP